MFYTLAQAERKLARFADGGGCDVRASINDALEQLSNLEAWRCLRRIVRITVQNDVLPLPQSVEAVLRVCVEGAPSHIFGTDYQFMQSGVGDLDWEGNQGIGISDYGAGHATMFDIDRDSPGVPLAFSSHTTDTAKTITVYGTLPDGTEKIEQIKIHPWAGADGDLSFDPSSVVGTSFVQIDRVVLPEGLKGYIALYSTKDGDMHFLAKYHPNILIPDFRRYRINWRDVHTQPTSVLAEVRLKCLPLIAPTDVIPFDSLAAVQYMMQAVKEIAAGNLELGMNYQQLAISRMEEKETAQTRVQGLVVENDLHMFSPGAATGERLYNL